MNKQPKRTGPIVSSNVELLEEAGKLAIARAEVLYFKALVGHLRGALAEIHSESVGALNNAFPEDAPEVVESMAQKAELALKNTPTP